MLLQQTIKRLLCKFSQRKPNASLLHAHVARTYTMSFMLVDTQTPVRMRVRDCMCVRFRWIAAFWVNYAAFVHGTNGNTCNIR